MTSRYVDGQPELSAITAPRLQFAAGFPNGVFALELERHAAAERGGDALLREARAAHATLRWAEYKFGPVRRLLNRGETRGQAFVTHVRFGAPDTAATAPDEKSGDTQDGTEDGTEDGGHDGVDTAKAQADESGSGSLTRHEFRQAYFSLCGYADRLTVYAGHLAGVVARGPGSALVAPLAPDAVEQVQRRAESAYRAVGESHPPPVAGLS